MARQHWTVDLWHLLVGKHLHKKVVHLIHIIVAIVNINITTIVVIVAIVNISIDTIILILILLLIKIDTKIEVRIVTRIDIKIVHHDNHMKIEDKSTPPVQATRLPRQTIDTVDISSPILIKTM